MRFSVPARSSRPIQSPYFGNVWYARRPSPQPVEGPRRSRAARGDLATNGPDRPWLRAPRCPGSAGGRASGSEMDERQRARDVAR